eukprot:TRINITY_DN40464_c0_g1_i1.p1 TRINITY_DN40464_c0_g1~~TRINITY_DN40464_c0_g1_i1.p1  ORF type:complete len:786 (-),score=131.43 TRINITY_DN40464_c0_g1_i1:49-2406(-)
MLDDSKPRRRFRGLYHSLRFADASLEAQFLKNRLDAVVGHTAVYSFLCCVLVAPQVFLNTGYMDTQKGPEFTVWIACVSSAIGALGSLLITVTGFRRVRPSPRVREVVFTVSQAMLVGSLPWSSRWRAAVIFNRDPRAYWGDEDMSSDTLMTMFSTAIVAAALSFLPRTSNSWLVAFSSVVSYWCASSLGHSIDGPRTTRIIASTLTILCLYLYISAQGRERCERTQEFQMHTYRLTMEGWIDAQVLVQLSNGMPIIVSAEKRAETLFGRDLTSTTFGSILAEAPDRFMSVLTSAFRAGVPQKMVMSLEGGHGCFEAELFIVPVGPASCSITFVQLTANVDFNTCSGLSKNALVTNGTVTSERPEDASVDIKSSCTHQTTETAKVFKRLGSNTDIIGVAEDLEHIMDLLIKERLLLTESNLEIDPVPLSSGGFGSVYHCKMFGSPAITKFVRDQQDPGNDANNQTSISNLVEDLVVLSNEISVLRHIKHPNVVQLYGVVVNERTLRMGMAMELVNGVTFSEYQKATCESTVFHGQVLLGLARAVLFLHSQSPMVVHGDLKPANVLVDLTFDGPRARLIDFGLARRMSKSVQRLGMTKSWAAPEVRVDARPSPLEDVFSFGCLVYFLDIGAAPREVAKREVDGRIVGGGGAIALWRCKPSKWCDHPEKSVLVRCLACAQADRPSMAEVLQVMENVQNTSLTDHCESFAVIEMLRRRCVSEHAREGPCSGSWLRTIQDLYQTLAEEEMKDMEQAAINEWDSTYIAVNDDVDVSTTSVATAPATQMRL